MVLRAAASAAILALVSLSSIRAESFGCGLVAEEPNTSWIAKLSKSDPNVLVSFVGHIKYASEHNPAGKTSSRVYLPLGSDFNIAKYQSGKDATGTLTLVKDCAKLVLDIEKVPVAADEKDVGKKQVAKITVMTRASDKVDDFVELCNIKPTNMDFDNKLHYASSSPYSQRSFKCKTQVPSVRGSAPEEETVATLIVDALEFEICSDEDSAHCESEHEQGEWVTHPKALYNLSDDQQ